MERLEDFSPNSKQQYLTHGLFRYFGKLPPTVTGRILDELSVNESTSLVDVMSGSGTTLVEAGLRSAAATGIDCNPLSVMVARVKTTPLAFSDTAPLIDAYATFFGTELCSKSRVDEVSQSSLAALERYSAGQEAPPIRNLDHWFAPVVVTSLLAIRSFIEQVPDPRLADLLRVAFASSIRSCSNASTRTGRLFRDTDKRLPNPIAVVLKRLRKMSDATAALAEDPRWAPRAVEVLVNDARRTGLPDAYADVVFCHPPYFALYRYSSDILRFEMEWLGISRSETAAREIEDGFKTTNAALVADYISDMADVMSEARRICREGGKLVIVTADSTLRKERLQIMDPLVDRAQSGGWKLDRRAIRPVRFAQASYHRSANNDIRRPEDEILVFKAI